MQRLKNEMKYDKWSDWSAEDKKFYTDYYAWKQQWIAKTGFNYTDGIYFANPEDVDHVGIGTHNQEWVTTSALEFLDQANAKVKADPGTPFYLHFCPTLPHPPGMDKGICSDIGKCTLRPTRTKDACVCACAC